jgi:DNA-directed RNA polymerase specialized sigma24 family protein
MIEPLTAPATTRAAVLFERFAASIANRLEHEFPWADPDLVSEAAVEAILEAAHDDSAFDPHRGSYESFLYWLAREHVRTALRSEKRRKAREEKKAAATVTQADSAAPYRDDDACDSAEIQQLRDTLARTDAERAVLDLWLAGVNSPSDVAHELGFGSDADAVRRARALLARLRQRIHRERERRLKSESSP